MTKQQQLEQQGFKTYETDAIQVFWNPNLCTHSGICAMSNRGVFNPVRRPWIDLSQGEARDIAAIIDRCPSHALQYELKDLVRIVFEEDRHQAAAYDGDQLIGECQYDVAGTAKWIISHTGVRPAYNGHGIARRLVETVVEAARARHIRIVPLCSYARHMLTAKDEYNDVL